MYITLQNVKSGVPIDLDNPIDNRNANLSVTLHELFYTVKWTNISDTLDNNWMEVINKHDAVKTRFSVQDGYYDFCRLSDELFKPLFEAKMNPANLRVTLSFSKQTYDQVSQVVLAPGLARILGFVGNAFNLTPRSNDDRPLKFIGDRPINLTVYNRLFFYLKQLSTSQNLLDGKQSSLLRAVPTQRETYCETVVVTFSTFQQRKLSREYHTCLCFEIKDSKNRIVPFDDLTLTLEIN